MNWRLLTAVLIVSLATALIVTPYVRRLALRIGMLDEPGEHRRVARSERAAAADRDEKRTAAGVDTERARGQRRRAEGIESELALLHAHGHREA